MKGTKKNLNEGTFICESSVVEDPHQKRIGIPYVVDEILGIKKGDRFRWYIQRREDERRSYIKISCVYVGNDNAKYKYEKVIKENEEALEDAKRFL